MARNGCRPATKKARKMTGRHEGKPRDRPPRVALIVRQEKFARLYLKYFGMQGGARRAAIEAGYSKKDTGVVGKITAAPEVTARIRQLLEQGFDEDAMSARELVARLSRIARGLDIRRLFDAQGAHIPPQNLDPEIGACISSIETELRFDEGETDPKTGEKITAPPIAVRKVKLINPVPVYRLLAEINGLVDAPGTASQGYAGLFERMDRARARRIEAQRNATAITIVPNKERAA
jgi:phage terminase small subunit